MTSRRRETDKPRPSARLGFTRDSAPQPKRTRFRAKWSKGGKRPPEVVAGTKLVAVPDGLESAAAAASPPD
ncbi:hypothetical protein BaRGS_00002151 [Batillaria attramentaria]|uniref:Uncharacterized protein n=1 Tax=Batillaria attramentaria TaxID=370345 RepID=A0ABD0M5G8_9CAEN